MELVVLLPLWYQYTLVALLGLIIGSFLNVYIYRLHTGRSLTGSSHCLSCGTPLRWFELLPVVSFLALRGRCRSCGSYIPTRYLLVETLTALLFVAVFISTPFGLPLLLWLILVSTLIVIVVYDLYHLIIPDELVLVVTGLAALIMATAVGWQWDGPTILAHAATAFATLCFFGGLWLISHGRWIGLGDAKLATPLAFILGPLPAFSFIALSFWVGAALSVLLLILVRLIRRGKTRLPNLRLELTMKSEVPFAPFLILAFLLVALGQVDVLMFLSSYV